LSKAAFVATTIVTLGASHAPAPPTEPVVTYRTVYALLNDPNPLGWTVAETLVGSDGSTRPMGFTRCPNGWEPAGVDWLCDLILGCEADPQYASQTPAQKKKQLQDEGIVNCCGSLNMPPCPNFCGCNIEVFVNPDGTAGGSSSFCCCANTSPGGKCPTGWPLGFAF
jgi:hypothetical protein